VAGLLRVPRHVPARHFHVCVSVYSLWLRFRGRLYGGARFQRFVMLLTPSGFLCVSEAGTRRRPAPNLTHLRLLRTADSVSPVSAGSVLWSLTSFVVFYGILLARFSTS